MNTVKNNTAGRAVAAALMLGTALTTGAAWTTAARAQTATQAALHDFDIPAQRLADALPVFGRQAGLQVSAHGDLVREATTGGVSGRLSVAAALDRLLAGTGLAHRLDAGGVVIFEAAAGNSAGGSTTLDPLMVQGARSADAFGNAADRAGSLTVTREDLERRNPATLKDVFAGEATVSVGGGQPVAQKIYVQGIEETNLAVTIDGARQNNKVFHHNATTLIDPALLKAVRVDPGVAPADAGPGALGGAIVYETADAADLLDPGEMAGGYVSTSWDSNGNTFTKGGSVYGRTTDGFEGLAFFKQADGDNYEAGNGREVSGTGAALQSILAKGAWESADGHRFELSGEQVQDDSVRPFRANIGRLTNRPADDRLYDLRRRNLVATYEDTTREGMWNPRVVLGWNETDLGVPSPDDTVVYSHGETTSLSGRVENRMFFTPDDSVTAGVDFYDDEASYKDRSSDMAETATNVGVYAQARLQPIDPLRLSFGLRGDQQWFEGVNGTEIDHAGLSGNASVAWDVRDDLTLKAGYSNVFGGVTLAENFILSERWTYAQGIKPVRSNNVTLGAEYRHEGFTFAAGVFRSRFKDARNEAFYETLPNGGGRDYTRGAELTSDFETEGYTLSAAYSWGPGFARISYTDTDLTIDGKPGDSDLGLYLGTPVGQLIAVEIAHRFETMGLLIGSTVEAAFENDDLVSQGNRSLEAYQALNLYAEYTPDLVNGLTLRGEVNNVFDQAYADRTTYGQEFSNVDPIYEPGRSFLIKATMAF
ncbi:TonB-dependent receptor [Tistrella mobilis]|uniref:TonB-dependent receptor n=1 Tax=Tistrella mobilis TaxID=171437 RepID=UPI0035582AF3